MKPKTSYYIYGLKTIESDSFFYIGITRVSIPDRLRMHISGIKNGLDTNKAKCKVFTDSSFEIIADLIHEYKGEKKGAFALESKYIQRYLNEGHPLTNHIPKEEGSRSIRVRKITYKKARRYAFKSESSVTEVIDCALSWFMEQFPAEKFKLNKPSKK